MSCLRDRIILTMSVLSFIKLYHTVLLSTSTFTYITRNIQSKWNIHFGIVECCILPVSSWSSALQIPLECTQCVLTIRQAVLWKGLVMKCQFFTHTICCMNIRYLCKNPNETAIRTHSLLNNSVKHIDFYEVMKFSRQKIVISFLPGHWFVSRYITLWGLLTFRVSLYYIGFTLGAA